MSRLSLLWSLTAYDKNEIDNVSDEYIRSLISMTKK